MSGDPVRNGYWSIYAVCGALWSSGVLWLVFHHLMVHEGDYGPVPHPLERWWLVAHAAAAFLGLWMMGHLWSMHVKRRWRLQRHRKSGGTLFGVMLLLIISGFLLYYLPGEDWRAPTAIIHWVIGLAMPLALLVHWSVRDR